MPRDIFAPITRRAVLAAAATTMLVPVVHADTSRDPDGDPPPLLGLGGQYTIIHPARQVRSAPIRTVTGDVIDLGHFEGRVVLLNFCATWCAPCVQEMPALDRLAARDAGDIVVVPVSLDAEGFPRVARFYREHKLTRLGMYFDVEGRISYGRGAVAGEAAFALYGLPISYVIDKASFVRGYITGAVEWDSHQAEALLWHYADGRPA